MNEHDQSDIFLRLLKPGLWYCITDYEGCEILEAGTPVAGKKFLKLVSDGYVESTAVFEGFTTKKYRITAAGSAWLAALELECA